MEATLRFYARLEKVMKLLAKIGLFGVLAGATTALYADPVGG